MCNLLHERHFNSNGANHIDRSPTLAQANAALAGALAFERLVVQSRALPHGFQAKLLNRLNPIEQLVRDVGWHACQLLLGDLG